MRRRRLPWVAGACVLALVAAGCGGSDDGAGADPPPESSTTTAPPETTTTTVFVPSSAGSLGLVRTVTGDISPKSVVASGRGLVFAQNMMYRHSITVYDRNGELVRTIPDSVRLADFGLPDQGAVVQGAPVEAAFDPTGKHAYVSNYSMYGPGFGPEGDDDCPQQNSYDNSFLYRIDVEKLVIDGVIPVGKVPKYVAVSPDGAHVLASNWCSYDLSVVDPATNREVKRVPLGPYPRGIVVSPDSRTAYVAVMGTHDIARVDLATYAVSWIRGVGSGPRHLVLSPDGAALFVTLNGEGTVAKVDPHSGTTLAKVRTGRAPRSMDISADGLALYVVNYESSDMSKLSTADMSIEQSVPTGYHPIGVTYDRSTGAVWVANYGGSIMIFSSA
jgi:YVTN family beta-propeller protein